MLTPDDVSDLRTIQSFVVYMYANFERLFDCISSQAARDSMSDDHIFSYFNMSMYLGGSRLCVHLRFSVCCVAEKYFPMMGDDRSIV